MENNKDIHALESIDELDNYNTYIYKKILRHKQFLNSTFDTNWLSKEKFY